MHNEEILKHCFDEISKEEDVDLVESIPTNPQYSYAKCWKLTTYVSIKSVSEKIELYIGFSHTFPFKTPDIYYFDTQYDYFPHIDYTSRKLCYLEDGTTYTPNAPIILLRKCISKAKRLIEKGAKRENSKDFIEELYSHWDSEFNGEPFVNDNWMIYGKIPTTSNIFKVWSYKETLVTEKGQVHHLIIPYDSIDHKFETYMRGKPNFTESEILFLSNIEVPDKPPYCITPQIFLNWIKDDGDIKLLKKTLNKDRQLTIAFPLFQTNYFGGCQIPLQPVFRNGFRKLNAFDELTLFEKKNQYLQRFVGKIYSLSRITQRTEGKKIKVRKFTVVGLGSVGSNLCYFLSGWSNAEFILIDKDIMQPENIGRHLHGMKYIQQSKAYSMEEFLRENRPDMNVKSFTASIEDILERNIEEFNGCSAVFLCMGDCMSEQYVLSLVERKVLTIPIFTLWLEPFAIAGHLVYINPIDTLNTNNMLEKDTMLYKHNLILSSEYTGKGTSEFVSRDAGCNGAYTLYSGNDVMLFLSAIYPIINKLIEQPSKTMCYRWVGNINNAKERNIALIEGKHINGDVTELPL